MKQIFDWLREETEAYADEAGYYPKNRLVLPVGRVKRIINEAEAKWEAEVCEWEALGDYHKSWNFCPYCGKPIKISEVE